MRIQADYTNSSINRYKNNYITNINKNDISFEGLHFDRLFSRSKSKFQLNRVKINYASEIGAYLGIKEENIKPIIKNLDENAINFLRKLSKKYSDLNFYSDKNLREDPELVFSAFNSVSKPENYHYSALTYLKGNFEYIARIFSIAKDKNSLEFATNFQKNILNGDRNGNNMIIEMLQSPFKKQYIEHLEDFKSYILLNIDNPEAIKELDLLMQNQHYNRGIYDIQLTVKRILNSEKIKSSKVLNNNNIERYYTNSGAEFLDQFVREYYGMRDYKLSEKCELDVLDMFKSTTKDNIHSRMSVLSKFNDVQINSKEGSEAEISAMRKLFALMDSDKHARNFVDKLLEKENIRIESIQKLNEILETLTPKKADIFSDNVLRILKIIGYEDLLPALEKHYNNPFFETEASKYNRQQMEKYGFKTPESRFSRFKKSLINKINEIRYSYSERKAIKNTEPIVEETKQIQQPVENLIIEEAKPIQQIIEQIQPVVPEKIEHVIHNSSNEDSLKLINTVKESSKARKLRLIGEVNDFISKKLSAKTVENQGEIYSKNATKMRLKMLPEIFDSIKETRQADRAVGKLKSNSSNKDAVELYRLINGSNRKYVKYLLEKRNTDGTRMFEVRDIIAMVEKANKRVDAMKKASPDFKAKDAKAYFDHLYDSKIEQYGKVKRPRKK